MTVVDPREEGKLAEEIQKNLIQELEKEQTEEQAEQPGEQEVGPPHGSRFITPMQAPVRQRRIRESMFIFLYTGYIAGIVMRTVTAVVPSR